ncbi:MAG: hypothetical protein ACRCTI_03870, partial [Beijerinckiaceae bacterium]
VIATMNDMQRAMQNDGSKDLPRSAPLERPDADDGYAMVQYLMKSLVQTRIRNREKYESDLAAADWERLTDPVELRKANARQAANARVAAARRAVDMWIASERATTREFIASARAAELPAGFRQGFERRNKEVDIDRQINEVAASEHAIIDAMAEVADVLLTHRWQFQNEQWLFETDAGLEAYQRADLRLQEKTRAAEAWQRNAVEKLDAMREQLSR